MATRFKLTSDTTAPDVSPAFQSYTHASGTRRRLLLTDSSALTTTAQTPDAADHLVAGDTSHVQFVSDPLGAQTFVSGAAFKFAIQGLEANAANNLQVQIWIGIYSNDGSTLLATLRSKVLEGLELGTTLSSRFFSGTLSGGYTTTGGERLVIEFSVSGTPTATSGTQGHNASLRWGGGGAGGDIPENDTSTGTTLNPWIEFAADVVWAPIIASLSGVIRAGVTRLKSLGIVLASKAAPTRALPLLLGATLTVTGGGGTTTNVAGTVRSVPRLQGTLGTKVALAGRTMAAPRLQGVLAPKSFISGVIRSGPRLQATLGTRVALAGVVRSSPRLQSTLSTRVAVAGVTRALPRLQGAAGTRVALAGVVRSTSRLQATSLTLRTVAPLAGVTQVLPRLQGALTTKVSLAGTARSSARATGSLSMAGGTPVAVAGVIRSIARLRSTGIVLAYPASAVRVWERLRGELTTTGGIAPLAGTIRVIERLRGNLSFTGGTIVSLAGRIIASPVVLRATETTIWRYAAPSIGAYPVARGALTFASVSTTPVAGRTIASPTIAKGSLSTKVALRGSVVSSSRLTGALQSKVSLLGTTRSSARALGSLTVIRPASASGKAVSGASAAVSLIRNTSASGVATGRAAASAQVLRGLNASGKGISQGSAFGNVIKNIAASGWSIGYARIAIAFAQVSASGWGRGYGSAPSTRLLTNSYWADFASINLPTVKEHFETVTLTSTEDFKTIILDIED